MLQVPNGTHVHSSHKRHSSQVYLSSVLTCTVDQFEPFQSVCLSPAGFGTKFLSVSPTISSFRPIQIVCHAIYTRSDGIPLLIAVFAHC